MSHHQRYPEINALGFVEVLGLAAAIETADAMVKCAQVKLLRPMLRDPAQTTLVVAGDLAACRAAVDAGQATAQRGQAFVAAWVTGRPDDDTADFVLRLAEAGRQPFGEPPAPQVKRPALGAAEIVDLDALLLDALKRVPSGSSAPGLIRQLPEHDPEAIRSRLAAMCAAGRLRKQHGRYHLLAGEGEAA